MTPMLKDTDRPNDETIGEKAYRQIRSDIIFGRLQPGQKLRLDDLKQNYSTSISTLRELLNRLASEGFITAEGHRGFEVTPVSIETMREVAAMRLLLECHALTQSFAAGDMEWEGRVVAAHHKLSRLEQLLMAGENADAQLWKRYDWEFHHALISGCRSTALLDTHAGIYDKYLRYQMIAVIFRGEIAAAEHRQLLDCALKRDAVKACKILKKHIDGCVDYTAAGGRLKPQGSARAAAAAVS